MEKNLGGRWCFNGSFIELDLHAGCLLIRVAFWLKSETFDEGSHCFVCGEDITEIGKCVEFFSVIDELAVHGTDQPAVTEIGVYRLVFP